MVYLYNMFKNYKKVFDYCREADESSNDAEALMNYSHALTMFKSMGDIHRMGKCSANIGNIHFKMERYAEAQTHYKEAIKASESEIAEISVI